MTLNKPKKKRLTVESVVVFSFHPDLFQFDFQHRESPTLLISDRGGKSLSACVFISDRGFFYFLKVLLNSSRFVFKVTLQLLSTSEQRLVKNVSENCF